MGEAVARLPPSVARLRINGDANNLSHSWKTGGALVQRSPISDSVRPAHDFDGIRILAERAKLYQILDAHQVRESLAVEVRHHTEVGVARDEACVWIGFEQIDAFG